MNGIIYCRVSSKEQLEGTSLEVQEAACRDYGGSNGITVLRAFVEQGESAKFADRTQLLDLIDFCRTNKGEVQVLLVWKVDRFARNVADHFSIKATLGKYGVRIMSVTEPIDAKPEGRLMETILAGFAQFDNDIRAMRTIQGMRRKIQEGILPWGPPLGYKSSVANGEKKALPDVAEQPAFGLLQKAWKAYATGAYTQAEAGRMLVSWGLTNPDGRPYSPQFLHQMFTNPYYAGMLTDPWSGEQFDGRHPAMVTREEFSQVQRVIAGRGRSVIRTPSKERPEFPLRGVVRCDGCLHYFTGALSRGRSSTYPYYVCHCRGCPNWGKSRRADDVHREFDDFLGWVAPKPDVLVKLGDLIAQSAARRQEESAHLNKRGRVRVAQLDREIEELIRMRTQGLITDEEFVALKNRLLEQRSSVRQSVERNSVSVDEVREKLDEIVMPLVRMRESRATLEPERRRRFDRLLIPTGFVVGQSRTADLGLLFSTISAFGAHESTGVPFASEKSNRVMQEIRAFWNLLNGIDEPKKPPKRRFDNSHRRWLGLGRSNREPGLAA